jgi:hypothetical protein
MDSARFSRDQLAFLIGVPLAWAVLLLFHPTGEGETITYAEIHDKVTPWMAVHIGMLFFIPLIAVVIYLILRGVEGTAARVGRWALVPFVVFYGAFETLIGLGNGILVHEVNGMVGAEKAGGAALIAEYNDNVLIKGFGIFPTIGSLGFIAAVIATGIALHRHAGAPLAVPVLLGLSGFLITAHPPPFGPTGLALFIGAVVVLAASGSAQRREPASRPPTGVAPAA